MPNLTSYFYEVSKQQKTNYYIETGTYLGDGIKTVLNNYKHIYSIELSEKWYNYNKTQFINNDNVNIIFGDSKKKLPELLDNINEPITIYLDAHYSGGTTAFGDEEVPLLFELDILKNREYNDIIIIDDCRLLGKTGICGNTNDNIYPIMTFDWRNITEEKIIDLMKKDYILLKNDNHLYTDGAEDQIILFKNN